MGGVKEGTKLLKYCTSYVIRTLVGEGRVLHILCQRLDLLLDCDVVQRGLPGYAQAADDHGSRLGQVAPNVCDTAQVLGELGAIGERVLASDVSLQRS